MLSVVSHISPLCHTLTFLSARKMHGHIQTYKHTNARWLTHTHTYTHACSHTYAAVTVHESHTTKHRWDLERDIVVGCQEWYRREAKSTVQPNCHCSGCL